MWGTVTAPGSQSCGVLRGLDPLDRARGDPQKFPRATEYADIENVWKSISAETYGYQCYKTYHYVCRCNIILFGHNRGILKRAAQPEACHCEGLTSDSVRHCQRSVPHSGACECDRGACECDSGACDGADRRPHQNSKSM